MPATIPVTSDEPSTPVAPAPPTQDELRAQFWARHAQGQADRAAEAAQREAERQRRIYGRVEVEPTRADVIRSKFMTPDGRLIEL